MPVTLQTTRFYDLRLGDQRMHRLLTAKTKEAATEMGLLDRIKDWFCSGKKKNCLNLMYDLLTNIETFKAEHPEKLEELRSLFRHADVDDLIHFWHAHDENDESLLGRAVLINDEASRATIKRCLAVLECFPLERFQTRELAALIGCANKDDKSTVLGLALKNNNPQAVNAFEALFQDFCQLQSPRLNAGSFAGTWLRVAVFGYHIWADLLGSLITSKTPSQLNAVSCCLELIKPMKSEWLSSDFTYAFRQWNDPSNIDLLKSALIKDDNPALAGCCEAILSMLDNTIRSAFAKENLLPDFVATLSEIMFERTTEVEPHDSFNAFNRLASLFQRLDITVPVSCWDIDACGAVTNIGSLMRSALNFKRYDTAALLLKITGSLGFQNLAFGKMISSHAAHLVEIEDYNGLKTLLESGSCSVRTIVDGVLLKQEKIKATALAEHLVVYEHWEIIDGLINSGQSTQLARKLAEIINEHEYVQNDMAQYYLDKGRWLKVLGILSALPTAKRSRLCGTIFSNQTKIAQMFNGRQRYDFLPTSLEVIPDDCMENFIEIILSAPDASAYFTPHWSFLKVVQDLYIDDDLKKRLMGWLAAKIKTLPEATQSLLAPSALDIWTGDGGYLGHEEIANFVLALKVREGNQGQLTATPAQLKFLVDAVAKTFKQECESNPQRTGEFMLNNNGFFVQLMMLCTKHGEQEIRQGAEQLYDQYLALEAIQPHARYLAEDILYADGIRSNATLEQVEARKAERSLALQNPIELDHPVTVPVAGADPGYGPVEDNDPVYVFVCPKPQQGPGAKRYYAVLLSKNNIQGMLGSDAYDWPTAHFTDDSNGQAKMLHAELASKAYLQFPVFAKRYTETEKTRQFKNYFKIIDLNYVAASGSEQSLDYTKIFLDALSVASSTTIKLTRAVDQDRLQRIFGKYLTQPDQHQWTSALPPTMEDSHLLEIYRLYGLKTQTQPDKLKTAQTLFCLATLFCRFSSETMFGESGDSPSAIRYYAAALLKQAHQLAPQVLGSARYDGFMRSLLGFGKAQTCTNQLSTGMADFISTQQSPQFKQTWAKLKPVRWSV